jgi:hypothetical protein
MRKGDATSFLRSAARRAFVGVANWRQARKAASHLGTWNDELRTKNQKRR